ncbi:hypothetical protein [Halopenitus persicus]|uniref:hypothetical protein n=1 Tax=Halopenitus persicus TaxID=1048396 RepID=UPI0012FDE24B|nr:hypothetical protein [Halopenitus persicus]
MRLSSREVFQLADRCLASAGLSRGVSKTNAESVWWTELYKERGLTSLHKIINETAELDQGRISIERQSSNFAILNEGGQPCIVSSTPALDLSCSKAKESGLGITYIPFTEQDSSFATIGHTAYNAASRGLISIVLTNSPDGSRSFLAVPGEEQPIVAETKLQGPSESYRKLRSIITNGIYDRRHSPLVQAFFDQSQHTDPTTTDADTLQRLLAGAIRPASGNNDDSESGFVTICYSPTHPQNATGMQRVAHEFVRENTDQLTTVYEPPTINEKRRKLINEGVVIERDVWEDLFEWSNGIFSPDSVGSETGAGPGLER